MEASEPLRIRVVEERHAVRLADELVGLAEVDVRRNSHSWELTLACKTTDRTVVHVLNAVRRTLDGDRSATAEVHLDGRRYHMQGE